MTMNLLITGGAGFIGSKFVDHTLETHPEDSVYVLDALTYAGTKENLDSALANPRCEFIQGDVSDRELVFEIVEKNQIDAIVNFAAESHVDRSIEGAEPFVRSNVQGTQTLLDADVEIGVDRFLQISTDEVYGQILDGEFSEDDCLNPRNPYAATKASADLLVESYAATHNLPVLITRTCNNFGPRQHPEKFIPKLIQNAVAGKELPIYGDGSNVREWIYVDDNSRAIDLVLREGSAGEIYNIGTGDERANIDVAEEIIDVTDSDEDQITFVEDRPGHDQRYALETEKIEQLGWSPEWSFTEGLRKTIDYYI